MDDTRFDHLARWLGGRASRRATLGAALTGLALAHNGRAAAQQASPDATPATGEKPFFMFVQTAASGRGELNPTAGTPVVDGTPIPGGGARFLLTLEGHAGQTIYFSDRPAREVGAVPTQGFLTGLGFGAGNPPNAALVAEFEAGQGVVVLQLLDPIYDAGSGTLQYGAEVLQGYGGENLRPVIADQVAARLPAEFGPASLFIDDCPSYTACVMESWAMINGKPVFIGIDTIGPIPGGPYVACFDTTTGACRPCDTTDDELRDSCNGTYPDICIGACFPGS